MLPDIAHLATHLAAVGQDDAGISWMDW